MGVGEPWAYGETNTSVPDSGLLGWRVQGVTEGFSGGSWGKQDSELPRQVSGRGVWLGHILEQKGPTFEFQRRHPWAVLRALGHVVTQKGRSHPHRAVGGSGAVLSICPARSLDQAAASVLCLPLSQGSMAVRIVCKGCGPPWRLDSRSLPWGPALPVLWEEEGAHVSRASQSQSRGWIPQGVTWRLRPQLPQQPELLGRSPLASSGHLCGPQ